MERQIFLQKCEKAWHFFWKKEMFVIRIFCYLTFFFATKSICSFWQLYEEMSQPISLYSEQEIADDAGHVTPYYEAQVLVRYGTYSGMVTLYGANEEYLNQMFYEQSKYGFAHNMPYLVVEEEVLTEQLVAEGEKHLQFDTESDMLLETLYIGEKGTRTGRICGVIPGEKRECGVMYTTLKHFEHLTEGNGTVKKGYLFFSENAFDVEKIKEDLQLSGYAIDFSPEQQIMLLKWQVALERAKKYGIIASLLGAFIVYELKKVRACRIENEVKEIRMERKS